MAGNSKRDIVQIESTECDGRGIVNEGGCLICKDCGWSKCE